MRGGLRRGMSRAERIAIHKKQELIQVKHGKPTVGDLSEGVISIRSTDEGIVEYLRHNNQLYKKVLDDEFAISETSFGDDGYMILPNGFILQWGQETIATTNETVTFPIPFPNACLNVTCSAYDGSDSGGIAGGSLGISTLPTKTTVIFTTNSGTDTVFWQAIGH